MAKSAPEISFNVANIDYGTIDVGGSSAVQQYYIYGHGSTGADLSYARAINMSISFKGSYQASEAKDEGWVFVSTASENYASINSIGGNEVLVGSITAGSALLSSGEVLTYVSIPAGATSAGHVGFYLHHRYQYTG